MDSNGVDLEKWDNEWEQKEKEYRQFIEELDKEKPVRPRTALGRFVPTRCAVCGNVGADEPIWDMGWSVSDEEWLRIVPEKWQNKTICPWCFVKFAQQKGETYKVQFYPDGTAHGVMKELSGENPHKLRIRDETYRKLEYRVPFSLIQEIGRELSKIGDCPFEYMYVGGTQSPEAKELPRVDSDIDFFWFRPDFSGAGTPEEWGKYAKFMFDPHKEDKLKPLEEKYGRAIHITILPEIPDRKLWEEVTTKAGTPLVKLSQR